MAKAKKSIYPNSDQINTTKLKSFFDSLNCELITSVTISGNYVLIEIDEIVTLKWNATASESIKIIYDGTESTVYGCDSVYPPRGETLIAIWSNNFIIIKSKNNYDDGNRMTFIYEQVNESEYFGMTNTFNFNSVTIKNTDDNFSYSHKARLNYEAEIGKIDFTTDAIMQNGIKVLEDENFIACSIITSDQVITINGVNYYSIGTNTLAQLDED